MAEPLVACFKAEFDRFAGLMEQQIELCPDQLWNQKAGGYVFWQQILHTLACTLMFSATEGDPFAGLPAGREVLMLTAPPEREVSKAEMRRLSARATAAAQVYFEGLTSATLGQRQPVALAITGRDRSNQEILLAMVRHINYHLGCLDSILRDNGLPGVH